MAIGSPVLAHILNSELLSRVGARETVDAGCGVDVAPGEYGVGGRP